MTKLTGSGWKPILQRSQKNYSCIPCIRPKLLIFTAFLWRGLLKFTLLIKGGLYIRYFGDIRHESLGARNTMKDLTGDRIEEGDEERRNRQGGVRRRRRIHPGLSCPQRLPLLPCRHAAIGLRPEHYKIHLRFHHCHPMQAQRWKGRPWLLQSQSQ